MLTHSEENYLKAIYALQQNTDKGVSTSALSEYLDTKPASVSEMIKKLDAKSYVSYQKYYGVTLTDNGLLYALKTIRKHRLWETFLVEKLNFSWDEVHEVAEELEHINSSKLINGLDKFLDFPKVDPHGDAIPDADGYIARVPKRKLSKLKEEETATCIGVNDTSSEFLKFLNKHNIGLGAEIHVKQIEAFDKSMLILVDGKTVHLSKIATENIYVKS